MTNLFQFLFCQQITLNKSTFIRTSSSVIRNMSSFRFACYSKWCWDEWQFSPSLSLIGTAHRNPQWVSNHHRLSTHCLFAISKGKRANVLELLETFLAQSLRMSGLRHLNETDQSQGFSQVPHISELALVRNILPVFLGSSFQDGVSLS